MSYILEALKKAQAERQLGNAPTIHAPPPSYTAPGAGQGSSRLYLGIGLGVGVVVAALALLWPRPAVTPVVAPVALVTPPVPAPVPAPAPAPAPAPVPTPAPAPAPVVEKAPVRAKPKPAPVVVAPAPVAPPTADEQLRTLQQLPDALQREIPKLVFGGYIYSPTPGESLVLVDKMLRREGEEVAPGLVLERLTPKAAVMNYRGTRYRAAY